MSYTVKIVTGCRIVKKVKVKNWKNWCQCLKKNHVFSSSPPSPPGLLLPGCWPPTASPPLGPWAHPWDVKHGPILEPCHILIYQLPPSLIISSFHHITISPRSKKITWGTLSQKNPENVTVWHGSSMEYNRVFYEVKPLKISNLHTSMHIWWLLCKLWDWFIYNNKIWLFS